MDAREEESQENSTENEENNTEIEQNSAEIEESGVKAFPGALAIATLAPDSSTNFSALDNSNIVLVNKNAEVVPLSGNLAIGANLSGEETLFVGSEVNPYDGFLYAVKYIPPSRGPASSECTIFRLKSPDEQAECIAQGIWVSEYYEHDRSQYYRYSKKQLLQFDQSGHIYFLGHENGIVNDDPRRIYKIPQGAATPEVWVDNTQWIHGFDVTPDGVVFYWGDIDAGQDPKFIKWKMKDGTLKDLGIVDATRILYFATDHFGGLIYAPELDQRSDHHFYKISLDSNGEVEQSLELTTGSGGSSFFAWPILAEFSDDSILYVMASQSGSDDLFNDGSQNEEQIFHLFEFTLTQSESGQFSSSFKVVSASNENNQNFALTEKQITYVGKMRNQTQQFVKQINISTNQASLLELGNKPIEQIRSDSSARILFSACDSGENCDWGVLYQDQANPTILKDLGSIATMSEAAPILIEPK